MLTDTTIRRLETLGELAKQGKRINGLYRLLESRVLWWQAYANIHQNKGAVTEGADGTSLDGFSEERIERIIDALKSCWHWPHGKQKRKAVNSLSTKPSNGCCVTRGF